MSEEKNSVDEMKAAGFLFVEELDAMNGIKQSVLEIVQANPSATTQTIGRQTFDHLDAAALFLQNLGMFIKMTEGQVEAEVGKQPNLTLVDGNGKQS